MKKQFILAVVVLFITGAACSLQNFHIETIEPRSININEPLPFDLEQTEVILKMTGGKFNLAPGSEALLSGTINYNVEQWEPEFTRRENRLEIKQTNPFNINGIPTKDTENSWDLAISNNLPIDLTIEGGASKNTIDLTGVQLSNLKIIQGASETIVRFDSPNPIPMDTLSFATGVSSADIFGLGNANFSRMTFSGGAGDYTLDFTGNLTRDAVVDIKAGASNIKIIVPANMKVQINSNSTVSNINTEGTWLLTNDTYTTLVEGYTLTINLDLAVGNVNLIHLDQ
jgi:hypothetical protein